MKIKRKLVVIVLIIGLLAISLVINKNITHAQENMYSFDENKAKGNTEVLVRNIEAVQNKFKIKNGLKTAEDINDKINTDFVNMKKDLLPIYNMDVAEMENDQITVTLDENNEPIIYRNKNITSMEKIKSKDKLIDKEELKMAADEVAKSLEKSSSTLTADESKALVSESDFDNGFKSYKWARTYKGYKYDFDFEVVALDPSTGDVAVASKIFVSKKPNINIKLTQGDAEKIAHEFTNKLDGFKVGEIKSKDMYIVNPNYRWTNEATDELVKDTILSYTFTFEMINPYEGELIVWIDAENGSLLGGTITK